VSQYERLRAKQAFGETLLEHPSHLGIFRSGDGGVIFDILRLGLHALLDARTLLDVLYAYASPAVLMQLLAVSFRHSRHWP